MIRNNIARYIPSALRRFAGSIFVLTLLFAAGIASATEQENWIKGSTLTVQTLDKVTARIGTIEAEIGTPFRFGTLEITVKYCAFRPPEIPPEHAAFVEIFDLPLSGADAQRPQQAVFSGWMFASSPAISGLEHAVYDVTLLSCAK